MYKIMFVCLGNICRSPMAECIMSDMLNKRGLAQCVKVSSSATSSEEEGNGIYPSAVRKLRERGVPVLNHYATSLRSSDYEDYDLFLGMEDRNVASMKRILGGDKDGKVMRLLDFADNPRDIADPWWTGNFDVTFDDITEGCEALINYLASIGKI